MLLLREPAQLRRSTPVGLPVVAVCISGAGRGAASLRLTASALRKHLMEPARSSIFTVSVWLEDDAAELTLERELAGAYPTRSRKDVLRDLPLHLRMTADDALAARGLLGRERIVVNTLRMLHKLRDAEWLRRHAESRLGLPRATLVLRTRPDLVLTAELKLPGPGPQAAMDLAPDAAVFFPWSCPEQHLVFDQLFALSPEAASVLLDEAFDSAVSVLAKGQALYPERFLSDHIGASGFASAPFPDPEPCLAAEACPFALRALLVSELVPQAGESAALRSRDPFDTLRAEFPLGGCVYPPRATSALRALESVPAPKTSLLSRSV